MGPTDQVQIMFFQELTNILFPKNMGNTSFFIKLELFDSRGWVRPQQIA